MFPKKRRIKSKWQIWKYSWLMNRARRVEKNLELTKMKFSFDHPLLPPFLFQWATLITANRAWFHGDSMQKNRGGKSRVSWLVPRACRRGATFVLAVRNFEDQDRETFMKFPVPISNFDKFAHTRHAAKLPRKRFANL